MKNPNNLQTRQRRDPDQVQPPASSLPAGGTSSDISDEQVARRAYDRWEQSDRAHGRDQEHWFAAEQELRQGRGRRDRAGGGKGDGRLPAPDEL